MTYKRYLFNVWIALYNGYNLKEGNACLISCQDSFNNKKAAEITSTRSLIKTMDKGKQNSENKEIDLLRTSSANLFPVTSTPWNVKVE